VFAIFKVVELLRLNLPKSLTPLSLGSRGGGFKIFMIRSPGRFAIRIWYVEASPSIGEIPVFLPFNLKKEFKA